MRDMINDTNRDLVIVAIVLRVWNDTTYEQQLIWPKGKTIRQVLEDFQKTCLGNTKVYRVIDYWIASNI